MPKSKYTVNLSEGESLTVEAVSGPKAIIAAQALVPEGVEVRSVFKVVPVGHGKAWGRPVTDPVVSELLNRYPVICGQCNASVMHDETKIVSRPKPYPAGTKVMFGMMLTEEMRVCSTHPDDQITNWPKPAQR